MSLYLGENLISGIASPIEPTRNIGQIIPSTIPLTDAGLHLLDGSLILGGGSYSDFVNYIADLYDSGDYTAIFETEANWQSAVSTYGVCGKFVYDSVNNTVRLPKYNSKIYTGGGTAPVVGNGKTLGLTNGTLNTGLTAVSGSYNPLSYDSSLYGADVSTSTSDAGSGSYVFKGLGVTIDSTKSGIITQLSNITTALDGYYYIVIATSTKTDIQVDIDEIATDLNGKADVDLSNCTKPYIVDTYVNGTSWYRIWNDGWCEQGGQYTVTASYGRYTINLLKQYSDTNYSIQITLGYVDYDRLVVYYSPQTTTSSFDMYFGVGNSDTHTGNWRTAGFISQGA